VTTGNPNQCRASWGAIALAAHAGASLWISLGRLGPSADGADRIGVLPHPLLLGVALVLAVTVAWATALRTRDAWPLTLLATLWLPWLPMAVPPVLLIWDGPLEYLVWAIALVGVVAARLWPTLETRAWMPPARAPWIAAAMFVAAALVAAAALASQRPGGDEPHYLIITQSLLNDGDLRIANNHARGDYLEYLDHDIRPDFLQRGQDGEIYSIHAPGLPALLLPAYAIAGYSGALVLIVLLSAVAVVLLWQAAMHVTARADAAWAAVAALAASATFFFHSFSIYPDPVGAVIVSFAVWLLVRDISPTVSSRRLVAIGGALGLLPWLHTRFSLIAGALGLALLARVAHRPSWRTSVVAFLSLPTISALAWFAYFDTIYGTFSPAAPYGASRQTALAWIPNGLVGLAFDQQFGLIANAPVLLLTPVGLWFLWRRDARLVLEHVAVAVPYLLAVAAFAMWWGGWSAPARFLVVLMPLAVVPLAMAWAAGPVALRAGFVALTMLGAANVMGRVWLGGGRLLYNVRDGFDLLLDELSASVSLPLALPSVHRLGAEPAALVAAVWVVSGMAAAVVLHRILPRRTEAWGARWAVTGWAVVLASSVAASIAWLVTRSEPYTPAKAATAFVRDWRPDRRPWAVEIPALRRLAVARALDSVELESTDRRIRRDAETLLALGRVPAGDYRVVIDGAPTLSGTLTVSIGATSQTAEHWSVEAMHTGITPLHLRLPTMVHSITIRGDALARATIRRVTLRPQEVETTTTAARLVALRAARYGTARLFFVDDSFYVEPGGVWTKGNVTGEFYLEPDDGDQVDINVIAGPLPTTVRFDGPKGAEHLNLAPGEHRHLTLPVGLWRMSTSSGFRPIDYDSASTDTRALGARLEF
jgi:hypothetical protein